MELRPYVDAIQHQLSVAAAAGGDDAREVAERLTATLDSALRLGLLDALSEAATEITRDLAPGSVELRLRNREPSFVVTPPLADRWAGDDAAQSPSTQAPRTQSSAPGPTQPPPAGEDDATVRISLRLPEHLKLRVEHAAARAGVSINTWLIRAATTTEAAESGCQPVEHAQVSGTPRGGQRFNGWVR
jgi:hypothetical protein